MTENIPLIMMIERLQKATEGVDYDETITIDFSKIEAELILYWLKDYQTCEKKIVEFLTKTSEELSK